MKELIGFLILMALWANDWAADKRHQQAIDQQKRIESKLDSLIILTKH